VETALMRKASGLGVVTTDQAPNAIGPYSQGITTDGFVYTAGQVSLDPKTGEVVGKTIAEQTERVMQSLTAILQAGGSSLAHVVKTTVYLVDLADFPAMNEVYAKHFGAHKPARSTVQVSALPKGVRVEIDAVAVRT
jgi:2-iminobutanoate/2-iminopropanoate deaminase